MRSSRIAPENINRITERQTSQDMGEIDDEINDQVPNLRRRLSRKQSIVDVMGSDDLLSTIQTESLTNTLNYPEIDRAVNAAIYDFKDVSDGDLKLQREVELIKHLIHRAKEILDMAAHSPMLDKDTLTVLSCNVSTISVDELKKLNQRFSADKCFYCTMNYNYCYDVNHDSIKCIFEDSASLHQIESIIQKYGHKNLRQYELADMLSVYKLYRERGLVN